MVVDHERAAQGVQDALGHGLGGVGSSAGTVDVVNGASVITEHGRL